MDAKLAVAKHAMMMMKLSRCRIDEVVTRLQSVCWEPGRKTGSLVGSQSQKNLKPMSSVLDPNKYAAMPISSQHKNGK